MATEIELIKAVGLPESTPIGVALGEMIEGIFKSFGEDVYKMAFSDIISPICHLDSSIGANRQSVSIEGFMLAVDGECELTNNGWLARIFQVTSDHVGHTDGMRKPNISNIGLLRILHDCIYILLHLQEGRSFKKTGYAIPVSKLVSDIVRNKSLDRAFFMSKQTLKNEFATKEYKMQDECYDDLISWYEGVSASNIKYTNAAQTYLRMSYGLYNMYRALQEHSKTESEDFYAVNKRLGLSLKEPETLKQLHHKAKEASNLEGLKADLQVPQLDSLSFADSLKELLGESFVVSMDNFPSIRTDAELEAYCEVILFSMCCHVMEVMAGLFESLAKNHDSLLVYFLKCSEGNLKNSGNLDKYFPTPTMLVSNRLGEAVYNKTPKVIAGNYGHFFNKLRNYGTESTRACINTLFVPEDTTILEGSVRDIMQTAESNLYLLREIMFRKGWTTLV